jgi:hypothetical protein
MKSVRRLCRQSVHGWKNIALKVKVWAELNFDLINNCEIWPYLHQYKNSLSVCTMVRTIEIMHCFWLTLLAPSFVRYLYIRVELLPFSVVWYSFHMFRQLLLIAAYYFIHFCYSLFSSICPLPLWSLILYHWSKNIYAASIFSNITFFWDVAPCSVINIYQAK